MKCSNLKLYKRLKLYEKKKLGLGEELSDPLISNQETHSPLSDSDYQETIVTQDFSPLPISNKPEAHLQLSDQNYEDNYSQAFKEIFTRAAPFAGSQFILLSADFLTVVMIASVSSDALAASNLISSLQNWFTSTAGATLSATSILAAGKIGTERKEEISEVGSILHHSWTFSLLLSIPGIIISLVSKPLLISLNQPAEVAELVQLYFYGYTIALPARFMLGANRRMILATSHPTSGFFLDIIYKSLNLGLAYCLIFGKLGLPRLEVLGMGIANSSSTILAFLGSTLFLMLHPRFRSYQFTKFSLKNMRNILWDLFKLGMPIGVKVGIELGALFISSVMIGALGKDQLAAHEASFQYVFIIATPTYSIMEAVSTFVSKALGKNKVAYAKKLGNAGAMLGSLIAALPLVLFCSIPRPMLSAFMDVNNPDNAAIVDTARWLLIINGIGQVPDSLRNIFSGGLSGFKDSITPTAIIMATVILIHVPLTYVMIYPMGLNAPGAMIARDIAMAVGSVIIARQWFRKNRVEEQKPLEICSKLSNCYGSLFKHTDNLLTDENNEQKENEEQKGCFRRFNCAIL